MKTFNSLQGALRAAYMLVADGSSIAYLCGESLTAITIESAGAKKKAPAGAFAQLTALRDLRAPKKERAPKAAAKTPVLIERVLSGADEKAAATKKPRAAKAAAAAPEKIEPTQEQLDLGRRMWEARVKIYNGSAKTAAKFIGSEVKSAKKSGDQNKIILANVMMEHAAAYL